MKIRVLFYRARIGDKHALDDAISLWTGLFNWGTGPYSHCELWVPREDGEFGHDETKRLNNNWVRTSHYPWQGTCYTSTLRGDSKGVVKRPPSEILKNPGRWDYCEIEIRPSLYEGGINYLMARIGKKIKYAFKTIASYFLPIRLHEEDADVCSELIYDVLVIWAIFSAKNKCPSPRRLSRWLTKRGYKINPLKEQ